jgi:hypothetical protein
VVCDGKGVDMSLLEATTQQVVYGPDGKAYGNPAIARNAGVNQYYREDGTPYPAPTLPPDFMPMPGPVVSPMPNQAGLTPYQRIMGQMMPTMNPYTGVGQAIAGYDPALFNRMRGSGLINLGGGGMGGGMGGGGGGVDAVPSAWDNMTNAEKAAYYAANPTMASITQFGQKAFGYTTPGMLQNYFNPGFVSEQGLIAMGVDPAAYQAAKESFRASEIADMNAGYTGGFGPSSGSVGADYGSPADGGIGGSPADADPGAGGYGGSVGADYGGPADGGYGGSPADADSGAGGYGNNDSSYGGFYNMGGPVDRVGGPNPPGPDDGTGMLQLGEYVIKKSAVKKYGQGLLDMINDGKIPAKKMKSLLG